MTSVVEITHLFPEARDNHTKVAGTPNDNHIVAFKEDLLNVCLQITFKDTDTGDPSSAILKYARYRFAVATNTPYDRQVAAHANYDPNLQADDPALRAKEENWATSTRNQSPKRAIERGAKNCILRLVDPTWLCLLKNETTFFTRVTPVDMLSELTNASNGLKRVNTVELIVSLTQLWEQDPRIPEYLNDLRNGQKKVKRSGLPFSYNLLAVSASALILKLNSSPKDRPKWDGKIPEDQILQ